MPHDIPPVRLRRARPGDLLALEDLERRCFAGDRLSRRALRRHLASGTADLIVAERNGALLGNALVLFRADSRAARLYSIAVAPQARGLGVGAMLLQAVERRARRRGADEMRLEVRPGNRSAVGLYEASGYGAFARREAYYEDGASAVRYRKSLLDRMPPHPP